MMPYRFVGLSTGRTGSRYLTTMLNLAGIKTIHENLNGGYVAPDVIGEVSAHLVTQYEDTDAKIWHFSRHPQPFVSSLIHIGFWDINVKAIHPYLRRTGDMLADSYRYWVDWNQRILDLAPEPQRTTFKIEDVSQEMIVRLARTIGADINAEHIHPQWKDRQEFAPIPTDVEEEVFQMMEVLGYARSC